MWARPVMAREDCAVTGGTGSLAQVVPLSCATWSPPAIQARPGARVTASSAPMSGTLTRPQVVPFQCSTSDADG